ncbi:carbohydrate ABC transporter permease [Aggregatilinea lenta]|uniref:carbohydrate ABC transporter permease n=1 Tax=Aggregatilinea lenta TaxID=913108 RepID=UPI000E5A3E4F|nr:sugar ABC transporter permease [Aggregatilinea lenta]
MATSAVVNSPPAAPTAPTTLLQRMRRSAWGYVFVSPWVILYLIFGLYPLVLSFYLTFFNYSFVTPETRTFVGIDNWVRGATDSLYWKSLYNIVLNQVVFITLKNGLGLVIATLLFRIKRGGRIFRTIYFLPVITSTVVLMTIADTMASPGGPVQSVLMNAGVLSEPSFWKSDNTLPMIVIALINTWKWFGISMVVLLAGMYGIDPRLYEAAAVDGARGWQMFRYITLPLLRPQLFFLLVVDVINGLQMFTEVFAIGFNVYGGINHQALTPVLYLYAQAFDRSNVGYASTLGLLLAVLIAVLTAIQFKFVRTEAD